MINQLGRGEDVRQLTVSFNTSEGEVQRKLHGLSNQHAGET